jgi:predicted phosphodiesterase
MNYIVFGDIHGRTNWLPVVESNIGQPVTFIFLGDYVSTHEDISAEKQMSNLEQILSFKEKYPDKIILLRGNHDLQHLGYYWAQCSGYFPDVDEEMTKIRDRFLEDTQWIFLDKERGILFSHAGVTNTWLRNSKVSIDEVNDLEPGKLFGFTPDSPWDVYGDSITQPPTWVRPKPLVNDAYLAGELIQVVGHTTLSKIIDLHDIVTPVSGAIDPPQIPHVWMCDCGLKEYLYITDEKIEAITIENS